MRYYQAAVIAFNNFRKTFPDSKFLEQISYLKVLAQFKLAQQSIFSKQLERYTSTVDFYRELVDGYPGSQYLKEAERMYTTSLNQINFLKSKNKNSYTHPLTDQGRSSSKSGDDTSRQGFHHSTYLGYALKESSSINIW